MKKDYMQPLTETVQVRLIGSVLQNIEVEQGSFETGSGLGKENNFEWDEEATPSLPHNINLWDE